jgi:hypothetical protein
MIRRAVLAAAWLAGCSHTQPAPQPAPLAGSSSASDRDAPVTRAPSFCPRDTEQVGAEPPGGGVVWCEDGDGLKQGPYRSWYDSGELEEEGQYQDGKRVGVWRFFDEKGELKGTRKFQFRVSVKLCVFEKSSKRGLDGALVMVTNLESGDTTTASTDPFGRATVQVDSGRGRIEVIGPFPRPEIHVELTGGARSIPVALDSAVVQRIVQRGSRLSNVTSCAH